jgi:hypothetical protein
VLLKLLNFLDQRRLATQGVLLLALLASAYFITRLSILDSPERWMPQTTLKAWDQFARHFEAGDTIGIGVHFRRPVREEDLANLRRLRLQLRDVPGIKQVYDCSLVAELIERIPLLELIDPAHAERFELYNGALWDEPTPGQPGRTLMTVCELEYHAAQDQANPDGLNERRRRAVAAVERIMEREQTHPGWGPDVDFHVASGIIMMRELEKRTRQVAWTFLPISIVVGLVAMLLGFRSLRALLVAIGGSAVAMMLVLGWLGAGGGTLGVVTMAAPALISVIGIATTIHFACYAADHGTTGEQLARHDLVRQVGLPCLGAAVATGFGFLMLSMNELAPIRDLGTQMFAGSLLAFLGVFLVSQVIPIRDAYPGRWLTSERIGRWAPWIVARPWSVVLATAVLMVASAFAAWPRGKDAHLGLHIDADPFSFFSDDEPIKIALNHFSQRKFAVYQLDVVLVPKRIGVPPRDLSPPDEQFLRNHAVAQEFVQRVAARQDLGVIRVLSTMGFRQRYQDFLAEMAARRQDQAPWSYLVQLGKYATSANVLNHTFAAWNEDKQGQGAMRLTLVAHDGPLGFQPLMEYVRQNLPEEDFRCYLAGSVAQNVDLSNGLGAGLMQGVSTSLAIMVLLCVFLFRSWRLAVIALVPNVFPLLIIFGLMGAFKVPISSGSAMVATIALGIAFTDTIHFVLHYRRRTRHDGQAIPEAVRDSLQSLGRPMILTSLVHVAGFLIFLFTDFVPLYQFGLLSSIAMLAALVGDMILLPNLLLVFDRCPTAGRRLPPPPLQLAAVTSGLSPPALPPARSTTAQ